MEADAFLKDDLLVDVDELRREPYRWHMRNEPRENSETRVDDATGRRYQEWEVGVRRNDSEKRTARVWLDPIPHLLLDSPRALQGWYSSKVDPDQSRPRPCYTDAILTQPYGGYCTVGCGFCYVNHGYRGYRAQGLTTVPVGYGAYVEKQLKRMRTAAAGYFSSFTDPFLPLEDVYHNTEQGARAFVAEGLPIFFLSRLRYPDWAFDLLRENPHSYAQMSINCAEPETWRRLSPNAQTLEAALDQVEELKRAGIYVSIQVNPIVPGVVSDDEIERLIWILAGRGANHLIFKYVEISPASTAALCAQMARRFGKERGDAFARLFVDSIGGQRTILEDYRLAGFDRFAKACAAAGVTMATCYEYRFERDAKGKIANRRGVSVGGEYLTADQCHGHRVPLYTRRLGLGDRFAPVEECPPSGCLTCADDNGGAPRCGSSLFGAAKALRLPDFVRNGVYDERDQT